MWRQRAKSTVKIHDTPSSPFSFSTFKDIQNLCVEDHPSSHIKKSSSIFHRVRVANTFLRSLSLSLPEPEHNAAPAHNKTTTPPLQEQPSITIPGADKRIVVYYTSLRVFIGGRYMGGAEEIRQLNESGELKKFIEGLPAVDSGVCDVCGGYRFILCGQCSGSHKLYIVKAGFKSCTACNENGLIRCPSCAV